MKKMITMVAVAVFAIASQAASFSWKLSTGATYQGMSVYAITGSNAASIMEACNSEDASVWANLVSGLTPVTATSGSRGVASAVTAGIAANDAINWLIVDGSVAEGNNWYVTSDTTIPAANVFEPPASGAQKTYSVSLAGTGTFSAAAVPEPTSGLLLLLGMAGLALKRKQA